jgi:hypothetical protein
LSFLINNSYIEGFLSAVSVINSGAEENTFRQGQNHFVTGICQLGQVSTAFENIDLAFKKVITLHYLNHGRRLGLVGGLHVFLWL